MKKIFTPLYFLLLIVSFANAQQLTEGMTLATIDKIIATKEATITDLKPDNESRIIWADKYKQQQSPIAFVYLHGFGASQREGQPIMTQLSEKYDANVYMSRLQSHGIHSTNSFEDLTPENYIASAEQALAIGKLLGKKVIIVSTSTGGTLSLKLASEDASILGLVLYSPFIDLINPQMAGLATEAGKAQFVKMTGSEIQHQKRPEEEAKYWSTIYHVNGLSSLIKMLKQTMTTNTFAKVTCPVFVGYYYKNETEQDQVVSVPAILKMYDQLGTPSVEKQKIAFPETGNHVIGCDLRSKDWTSVYNATTQFIDTVILK